MGIFNNGHEKPEVILTADRTLMSNHNKNEFLGFGPSAPPNVVPEWFFKRLFFPHGRTDSRGSPFEAPYGMRKIEAAMIDSGLNVLTVDPDKMKPYIEDAKVLCVHVMDPFGWGPSSSTFARILRSGEPYVSKYFRMIFEKPEVMKAKENGLKIVVGGPGSWQFKYDEDFLEKNGIDSVVMGEGDALGPAVIKNILRGKEVPKFVGSDYTDMIAIKQSPSTNKIPDIKRPSVNGLVEIGRGCCRGCKFCSVTTRPLRWYPYDKIEREIKVNIRGGVRSGILHAEDVLLYGSKTAVPEPKKVLKLQELGKKYYKQMTWSHLSFASVAAAPKLIEDCAEIINDSKQKSWGAEMGLETGSHRLITKSMRGKLLPFNDKKWPDIVKEAAGIMTDNNLVPACTLITGLPEETENDVIKTLELLDDLKYFKALIVPLFFVPLGQLRNRDWFGLENLTDLQQELLIKCMKHGLYHVRKIISETYTGLNMFQGSLYMFFIKMVERKAKKEVLNNM